MRTSNSTVLLPRRVAVASTVDSLTHRGVARASAVVLVVASRRCCRVRRRVRHHAHRAQRPRAPGAAVDPRTPPPSPRSVPRPRPTASRVRPARRPRRPARPRRPGRSGPCARSRRAPAGQGARRADGDRALRQRRRDAGRARLDGEAAHRRRAPRRARTDGPVRDHRGRRRRRARSCSSAVATRRCPVPQAATPPCTRTPRGLSDLAAQLKPAVAVRRIVVDATLFSGPTVAPSWDRTDVGTSYAARDHRADGRRRPAGADRRRPAAPHPDLAAGHELAAALGRPGAAGRVGHRARPAPHGSPGSSPRRSPTLVEQMLQAVGQRDRRVLARQVAVAEHRPASFVGAAPRDPRGAGAARGRPVGAGMKDGSGLSSRATGSAPPPSPRCCGWSRATGRRARRAALRRRAHCRWPAGRGTLADRYTAGRLAPWPAGCGPRPARSPASRRWPGPSTTESGRLLVFALIADRVGSGHDGRRGGPGRRRRRAGRCGCR